MSTILYKNYFQQEWLCIHDGDGTHVTNIKTKPTKLCEHLTIHSIPDQSITFLNTSLGNIGAAPFWDDIARQGFRPFRPARLWP